MEIFWFDSKVLDYYLDHKYIRSSFQTFSLGNIESPSVARDKVSFRNWTRCRGITLFAKKYCSDVVGVEIDSYCVNRIRERGIPCYQGDLNKVIDEIGSKQFDAIILHHVFDHNYHPQETLRNIYNLLNDNGIIYLSIPNVDFFEARFFKQYWRGLD